jgi:hypothetical protein
MHSIWYECHDACRRHGHAPTRCKSAPSRLCTPMGSESGQAGHQRWIGTQGCRHKFRACHQRPPCMMRTRLESLCRRRHELGRPAHPQPQIHLASPQDTQGRVGVPGEYVVKAAASVSSQQAGVRRRLTSTLRSTCAPPVQNKQSLYTFILGHCQTEFSISPPDRPCKWLAPCACSQVHLHVPVGLPSSQPLS